jgi:hypothetical protein
VIRSGMSLFRIFAIFSSAQPKSSFHPPPLSEAAAHRAMLSG